MCPFLIIGISDIQASVALDSRRYTQDQDNISLQNSRNLIKSLENIDDFNTPPPLPNLKPRMLFKFIYDFQKFDEEKILSKIASS